MKMKLIEQKLEMKQRSPKKSNNITNIIQIENYNNNNLK